MISAACKESELSEQTMDELSKRKIISFLPKSVLLLCAPSQPLILSSCNRPWEISFVLNYHSYEDCFPRLHLSPKFLIT